MIGKKIITLKQAFNECDYAWTMNTEHSLSFWYLKNEKILIFKRGILTFRSAYKKLGGYPNKILNTLGLLQYLCVDFKVGDSHKQFMTYSSAHR